jgi:hypothetical protein
LSNSNSNVKEQGDLANITIQLATTINKHLAEKECKHDIHEIVTEAFFGE